MVIPELEKLRAEFQDLIQTEYNRERHFDTLSQEEWKQLARRGKDRQRLHEIEQELKKLLQIKQANHGSLHGTGARDDTAKRLGLSVRSIDYMLDRYEANPHIDAIVEKKRGRRPGQELTWEQEVVICYFYLNPKKKQSLTDGRVIVSPSKSDVTFIHRVLTAFFPPERSWYTVYRYVQRLRKDNPLVVDIARLGEKYIINNLMPTPRHNVERANQVWQVDARPLPIYVLHNGIKTTVSLLLLIDHYSHYPIRARLVPRKEPDHNGIPQKANVTREDVGVLLASAIYDLDIRPERLYTDCGKENVGVGELMADLRGTGELFTKYVRRIPRRPRGGGAVEGMLKKFDELLKDLPANLIPDPDDPDKDNHYVLISRALGDERILPLEDPDPRKSDLKKEIEQFIQHLRKEPKRQNRKKKQTSSPKRTKAKTREELWTATGSHAGFPLHELLMLLPPSRRIERDARIDNFKIRFEEDEYGDYFEPELLVDEDWDRWLIATARREYIPLRAIELDTGWYVSVCLDRHDQYWCRATLKDRQHIDTTWRMERIASSLKRIRTQYTQVFQALQPLAEQLGLQYIYDTPGGRELIFEQPDEPSAGQSWNSQHQQENDKPASPATGASEQQQPPPHAPSEPPMQPPKQSSVSVRTSSRQSQPAPSSTALNWGDAVDLKEQIRKAREEAQQQKDGKKHEQG